MKLYAARLWSHQLFRFLVVGAMNTLFGYSLYVFALLVGLSYQTAVVCSTVLGAIFNFFTTGRIVFGNGALRRIFGFLMVYGVVLLVNLALLVLLVRSGANKVLAQALLLPCIVALSFVLNKYLVFRKSA